MEDFSITLCGKEIPVERQMLNNAELRYYPDNPRVHSLVWKDGEEPEQEEIQTALQKMDHVKKLIHAIKGNGGLTDPLLVFGNKREVIEGNSRLAAYRVLSSHDPIRWGKVKCDVVKSRINKEEIFALLVQYHIIGKKDWDPYEQAGLFWRRYKEGVSANQISKEMEDLGLSSNRVRHMIEVYSFMVDHNDRDPSRWSYYDEYLKSRALSKCREENPALDKVIVKKIKTGEIAKAVEMRDKVDKIARVGGKTLTTFMQKNKSLDTCYERAIARGVDNVFYNQLHKFRQVISDQEITKKFLEMPPAQQKKCEFEMRKIHNSVERILKKIK